MEHLSINPIVEQHYDPFNNRVKWNTWTINLAEPVNIDCGIVGRYTYIGGRSIILVSISDDPVLLQKISDLTNVINHKNNVFNNNIKSIYNDYPAKYISINEDISMYSKTGVTITPNHLKLVIFDNKPDRYGYMIVYKVSKTKPIIVDTISVNDGKCPICLDDCQQMVELHQVQTGSAPHAVCLKCYRLHVFNCCPLCRKTLL